MIRATLPMIMLVSFVAIFATVSKGRQVAGATCFGLTRQAHDAAVNVG